MSLPPDGMTDRRYRDDADVEVRPLPVHVDHEENVHKNESNPSATDVVKEQSMLDVTDVKNDSDAGDNAFSKNNVSNESTVKRIRENETLNSEHDSKNELGKKMKTSKRVKIAKIGKKINVNKKKKKISSV